MPALGWTFVADGKFLVDGLHWALAWWKPIRNPLHADTFVNTPSELSILVVLQHYRPVSLTCGY